MFVRASRRSRQRFLLRCAVPSEPNPLDPAYLRHQLQLVARRDAAAFRRLYDATSSKLFGLATRILIKRELAEEVLQDSFIAIWNSAASYQSHLAAPMTWMSTIVRNKAFDFRRRADDMVELDADRFDGALVDAAEDSGPGPADALQLSNDARALALCMDTLEGMHRQAIGLAFFHDLSHSEVAQQLTLPIGTVKTWIRRGLARLKTCLARQEQS